jgi:membrane protein insertase Oxa1/YidC/SpoIIIJ
MSDETKIDSVNFNGEQYLLTDLTPRVMDSLNVLIKLQGAIAELAVDLKVKQSAQMHISEEVKNFIKEDKIKPNPKENDEDV